ncbi:DUF47 domain-containing protein [Uliginosibacterium sediminicola]|uniref:DUF47 domain-containing protein n=1 Tax=Uliginosibacterium sediminicola TaxID=2024550 RepID=A0ABU9Z229_9RHOO
MFGRLMPREGRFFELFNAHTEQMVAAAKSLEVLMSADDVQPHIEAIDSREVRADGIQHEIMALLHRTFITPFDRDEIHALISSMDDIVDAIQDVAESITLYNVDRYTPDARQMASLSLSCCERVKHVVSLLDDMKSAGDILRTCREIDQIEGDCDRVMRTAISELFRKETDALKVMKLSAIYQVLEKITDCCKDVAKRVESIVLESA